MRNFSGFLSTWGEPTKCELTENRYDFVNISEKGKTLKVEKYLSIAGVNLYWDEYYNRKTKSVRNTAFKSSKESSIW